MRAPTRAVEVDDAWLLLKTQLLPIRAIVRRVDNDDSMGAVLTHVDIS